MSFILGAALIVAAIVVLQTGRLAVQRVAAVAPQRESLVANIFAICFTALFGPGVLLFFHELIDGIDLLQLAVLGASVAAVVAGARLVDVAVRRAAARIATVTAADILPH